MLPKLTQSGNGTSLQTSTAKLLTITEAITYFKSMLAVHGNYPRIARRYLEFCLEHNYSIDQISFSLYAAGKKGNLVSPVKKFLRFATKYSIHKVLPDNKETTTTPAANGFILTFLADASSLRGDRSKETYKTALNDFYSFLPEGTLVFTSQLIEAYLRQKKKEGKSAFTINNYLSAIRQYSKWLIKRRELLGLSLTDRQVEFMREVAEVKGLLIEGKYFKEDLSAIELEKFISGIDDVRVRAMVALMAYCGLRTVEVTRLSVTDVDLMRNRLLVLGKGASTKRVAKLFAPCKHILISYMDTMAPNSRDSVLFPALSTRQIRYYTDKYLKEIGLKRAGISAHSLRHTAAQRLLEKGADLLHIKNQLGHKRLSTTQFYVEKHAQEVFLDKLPD